MRTGKGISLSFPGSTRSTDHKRKTLNEIKLGVNKPLTHARSSSSCHYRYIPFLCRVVWRYRRTGWGSWRVRRTARNTWRPSAWRSSSATRPWCSAGGTSRTRYTTCATAPWTAPTCTARATPRAENINNNACARQQTTSGSGSKVKLLTGRTRLIQTLLQVWHG